jgi:hypothetical protein
MVVGLIAKIDALIGKRYVRWQLPHSVDIELAGLLHQHMMCKDTDKVRMTDELAQGGEEVFRKRVDLVRVFAQRAAAIGANGGSVLLIHAGVYALALDDFKEEKRESLLQLPLLYRAAELGGADPDTVFKEAASRALPNASAIITEFAARSASERSLASMGYREERDAGGVRFVREW